MASSPIPAAFENPNRAVTEAAVAAYALVACADGGVDEVERSRFRALCRDRDDALVTRFDALVAALLAGDTRMSERALEAISAIRGDDAGAAQVLAVARLAIVADEVDTDDEETAFGAVVRALGRTDSV